VHLWWREQCVSRKKLLFVMQNCRMSKDTDLGRSFQDHVWPPAFLDILPHRYSQLKSDLTTRLHKTTSLKSISQKRWLYQRYTHELWASFDTLVIISDCFPFSVKKICRDLSHVKRPCLVYLHRLAQIRHFSK